VTTREIQVYARKGEPIQVKARLMVCECGSNMLHVWTIDGQDHPHLQCGGVRRNLLHGREQVRGRACHWRLRKREAALKAFGVKEKAAPTNAGAGAVN
jgi:hypothetical protein